MKLNNFTDDVIKIYKLQEKVTSDVYVYVEVRHGMYGLPQLELLTQQLL